MNHSIAAGSDNDTDSQDKALSFLEVVGSTLAAAIGVQSRRNRQRDFARGRPIHFIVAGIVFVVLFVVGMLVVVSLVLGGA